MDKENNLYEKNLEAFRKRNFLLNIQVEDEKQVELNIVETKDNLVTLRYKYIEKEYYIHSKYKPLEEAKKFAEGVNKLTGNVLVFGLGLAYHIEEIIKKASAEARILVVVPSNNLLVELFKKKDYSKIIEDDRVFIYVYTDKVKLKNIISSFLDWDKGGAVELLYLPNYKNIFLEELEVVARSLKEAMVSEKLNKNTVAAHGVEWQENFFRNLPYIYESTPISYFKEEFKSIPVIIVSAGPSLNKNIDLLKDLRKRAIILATDSALKVLIKHNIKAHLVFTIDGTLINYEKFTGIDYSDTPLVYNILANENSIKEQKGKKIFYSSLQDYVYDIYKDLGIDSLMGLGGSVATAAFKMACFMGGNPVIFIGQDLSFTKERTHAEGTMHDEEIYKNMWNEGLKEATERGYYQIKGNYEDKVTTDHAYHHFLLWFEDAIEAEKEKRKFINATEGGAFIKGTEVLTLQETIDLYCTKEYNLDEEINAIIEKGNPLSLEELKKLLEEQKKIFPNIGTMKKKAFLATKSVEKANQEYIKNKVNSGIIVKMVKEMDKVDKYLKKQKESANFINYILGKSIIEAHDTLYNKEKLDETEQEKGLRVMEGNKLFYEGMYKGLEKVEILFKEYLTTMEKKIGGN